MPIHDVFSKRGKPLPDVFVYDALPDKLRTQIIHAFDDSLFGIMSHFHGIFEVSAQIHRTLLREHGLFELCEKNSISAESDIRECVLSSRNVPLVLDVVELVFAALLQDHIADITTANGYEIDDFNWVIDDVNHRFRENGVGYYFDRNAKKVIPLDSTLLHESAIKPVLLLLSETRFKSANGEFLQAFDDYKKGDFSDCVVKCSAAFESVLKIICDGKKWPHSPTDACGALVSTVVSNGGLDSFLAEPLKLIGSIRNKKSIAHGAGTAVKDVSESLARYCLNMTASSILYVVESTR